jgi:DNA modification methylase
MAPVKSRWKTPARISNFLPVEFVPRSISAGEVKEALEHLLSGELGFSGSATNYATHFVHPFAAKFPPPLPRLFIESLSVPGETVLDPMAGSGTALVEAMTAGRRSIGLDLDPLAIRISIAKTEAVDEEDALLIAEGLSDGARMAVSDPSLFRLGEFYEGTYDKKVREFFAYWFLDETIWQLAALVQGIRRSCPRRMRNLFEVIFSSTIIAKSGGVSLARDLAHSRPHKVEDKKIPDAFDLFGERARKIVPAVAALPADAHPPVVALADSRAMPVPAESVDLVVTSPPYANAIDYVRAHKFSLFWLGFPFKCLSAHRRQYIGSEVGELQAHVESVQAREAIRRVEGLDSKRAGILRRYFSDMRKSLSEMFRVLKPGRAAIVVVGSSTIRGVRVRTPFGLAEEAESIGFDVVDVRERPIDRDRRLMPISRNGNGGGIEARMHEEHVIGLFKPSGA